MENSLLKATLHLEHDGQGPVRRLIELAAYAETLGFKAVVGLPETTPERDHRGHR